MKKMYKFLFGIIFLMILFFTPRVQANAATTIAKSNGTPASGITVTMKSKNYSYRAGQRIVPTFTVKQGKTTLVNGKDYKYWTENTKNVGTAELHIKGIGKYKGIIVQKYNIVKRPISQVTIKLKKTTYVYTGKKCSPAITATFEITGKTITLKKDKHYTVSYKNNLYPGTGTVTVRLKGNYTGTKSFTFNIKRPKSGQYPYAETLKKKAGTIFPDSAIDPNEHERYFQEYTIQKEDPVYKRIIGKSYRENPDIPLSSLRYLKMIHRNYNGKVQIGEMICHKDVAKDLLNIFNKLYDSGYQIYSMYLVDNFWTGDALTTDEASVRNNNTSCFNYRRASDAPNLSIHAYGKAIDVNPRHNPYVVLGANGWYTDPHIDYNSNEYGYVDPNTRPGRPHAMTSNSICVQTFKQYGFAWGGDWGGNSRDFQHFVKS